MSATIVERIWRYIQDAHDFWGSEINQFSFTVNGHRHNFELNGFNYLWNRENSTKIKCPKYAKSPLDAANFRTVRYDNRTLS